MFWEKKPTEESQEEEKDDDDAPELPVRGAEEEIYPESDR